MIKRLLSLLLMLAISIDQFAQVIIRALPYVLFNAWKPSPNWTISGFLGALSAKGHPWAVFCAGLVDDVFGPGHCARAAAHDEVLDPGATPS